MDLNELLKQHQIALINDQIVMGRQMHQTFCMVRHYARRIHTTRNELGVSQYRLAQ